MASFRRHYSFDFARRRHTLRRASMPLARASGVISDCLLDADDASKSNRTFYFKAASVLSSMIYRRVYYNL